MNLQFGQEKCEKMHIGKTHNSDICADMSVDSWKEDLIHNEKWEKELSDIYTGTEIMKEVKTKEISWRFDINRWQKSLKYQRKNK